MKVLWFSNTPALGQEFLNQNSKGTGGWLAALDRIMQNEVDLSIAFLYPYSIAPFDHGKTKYYPLFSGNIILENLKQRWLNKVYDKEFLNLYLNIIDKVKPDIIHIHGTENSFACIIDHVKIPVVVSIQGNLTIIYQKYQTGLYSKYIHTKQISFNIKSLLFGTPSFYKSYIKLGKMAQIERRNLKVTKYIIGRTDWDRRITRILAPKSRYYVVNEILRDAFFENTWEQRAIEGKVIIHTTNGNSYYKGFETLCHALSLLNENGVNVEWRVTGISEDSLINKVVKKKLKKTYPRNGLVLLGSLAEKELVESLKQAHIYVMTSHIENSPNNLCEAMILGMPCIATNAGGTGSLLTDKQDGILIQDGDPWVMAGAILEMINNWDKAIEIGQNARIKSLERHDRKNVVTSLIETYKTIIKQANEDSSNSLT